jgi:hypothetical protein
MKKNTLMLTLGGVAIIYYLFFRKKTSTTTSVTPASGQTMTQLDLKRQAKINTFPSKTPSTANNAAQNAYILEGQAVKPPFPIMDIYMIMNGQKIPFNGWDSYTPYAPYLDISMDIFDQIPYANANLRFDGRIDGGKIVQI